MKGEKQLLLTIIFQTFVPVGKKKLENVPGMAQGTVEMQKTT